MNYRWSIVGGAALIAAAIAGSHRYEIASFTLSTGYAGLWRADNWTGEILFCDRGQNPETACEPARIIKR